MNLQVTCPYSECVFRCPFCIARNRKHKEDFEEMPMVGYLQSLHAVLSNNDFKAVVLTGATDPLLHRDWVLRVSHFVKLYHPDVTVEVQTHYLHQPALQGLTDVDVFAFSCANMHDVNIARALRIPNHSLRRATIVVSDRIDCNAVPLAAFDQVTFKQMQFGDDPEVNAWIKEHNNFDHVALEPLARSTQTSVVIDDNCQVSKDRYMIFRVDGKVYKTWDEGPKRKKKKTK